MSLGWIGSPRLPQRNRGAALFDRSVLNRPSLILHSGGEGSRGHRYEFRAHAIRQPCLEAPTWAERMKIEWFAPLPPCKSGIADYTVEIAEELGRRVDVRYWSFNRDEGRGLSPKIEMVDWTGTAIQHTALDGGIPVYHFGNHPGFHWPMWDLIDKRPGVAVIHDGVLLSLAADAFLRERSDPRGFIRAMHRYYGAPGRVAARNIVEDKADRIAIGPKFPFIEYVLERATAAIVHGRTLHDFIAARSDIPVLYLPLPYNAKLVEQTRTLPPRQSFGDPLQIVVFGHLAPNRRLHSILLAMSQSAYRERLHLTIAGNIARKGGIDLEIEKLGLARQVTLSGYLEEEKLFPLLAKSDVAINLRFPTMGEASKTQLHLWTFRKPTLVTGTGWYAEQPADTVVALDSNNEIAGIKSFFAQAFEKPQSLIEIGQRGRAWVTAMHSPTRYASGLVDFIAATRERQRDHWSTTYKARWFRHVLRTFRLRKIKRLPSTTPST